MVVVATLFHWLGALNEYLRYLMSACFHRQLTGCRVDQASDNAGGDGELTVCDRSTGAVIKTVPLAGGARKLLLLPNAIVVGLDVKGKGGYDKPGAGLACFALREEEAAAASLGISPVRFKLLAYGLDPGTNYLLAVNGIPVATNTADAFGRLGFTNLPVSPVDILLVRTLAVWDAVSNRVLSTRLP